MSERNWGHIPGFQNHADIPTRLGPLPNLLDSCWFNGPSFLLDPNFKFVEYVVSKLKLDQVESECKKGFRENLCFVVEGSDVDAVDEKSTQYELNELITMINYSTLKKLLIVTGYVFRFVNNMKAKLRKDNSIIVMDKFLTVCELDFVLDCWIIEEQKALQEQSNFNKLRTSLKLFHDDKKILRLKGRFANTLISFDEKFPIILRDSSYFTVLVVWDAHFKVLHHGVETTLEKVRAKFWIVKGRKTVKNIIR